MGDKTKSKTGVKIKSKMAQPDNKPITSLDRENLKKFGRTILLEDMIKDSDISQDPARLGSILSDLSLEVLGDPNTALRLPLPAFANEIQRYLDYNWQNSGGENYKGYDIDRVITSNYNYILEEYAKLVDEQLSKVGNNKEKAALILGSLLLQLEPESMRKLKGKSESERKNIVYHERLTNRPYLSQNVAFYEDSTQAESIMVRLKGAEFIEPVTKDGKVAGYRLNKDKLGKHYDINDKDNAIDNKNRYAIMSTLIWNKEK